MSGATGRSRGRPRKHQVVPATTTHINNFARVSKQAVVSEKELDAKTDDITTATSSARKRKAARSPEPEEITTTPIDRKITKATSKSSKKARLVAPEPTTHIREQQPPSTPRPKANKKRALSPAPEESPRTREAGNLFKRLRIDASPFPRVARNSSPLTIANTTRTTTPARSVVPDSDDEDNDADLSNLTTPEPEPQQQPLPQELLDLSFLYAAFLKTIVVHYAHNGTNTPVDLRQISQAVSLAWGKRRISLADVRRCVGVMDVASSSAKSPFYLVDYGSKKVCIELRDEHHGRPLDEEHLVRVFEKNLRGLWGAMKDAASEDMVTLLLGLPKAPVQSCDSVAKASPLLARGQRAMQELKAGMAARKDEKEAAKASSAATAPASGDAPKLSLLERLRLKESQLAALAGTGPTAAELERRAALQRADDVAAVVAMLARSAPSPGTGGRASFTMATVLQKLKDSLRLPISKDEGATCVRLLAGEIAPEWVRIVTIGTKENVVITVARAPSAGLLAERVRMLSA